MPKIRVNPDFYKDLGIPDFSDAITIKKAYRKKALEHHPDRGGSDEMMQKINHIYEVLTQYKKDYDNYLHRLKNPHLVPQQPKVVIVTSWNFYGGGTGSTTTGSWTSY